MPHVSGTFASTASHPTFVTTRTPLVSGWNDAKNNFDYQKIQEGNVRQNGTTGNLCMGDMRELPVVHSQHQGRITLFANPPCELSNIRHEIPQTLFSPDPSKERNATRRKTAVVRRPSADKGHS
jgi:hypothetical protein